jgi:hypothetical protein
MNWLLVLKLRSWPIAVTTILMAMAATWFALFSLGAFAGIGARFFEAVGLPMQLAVVGMGFFLVIRLFRNRPESLIRSVPVPVRIIVPVAVVLCTLQLRSALDSSMPRTTPSGAPARSFNVEVSDAICLAIYNGSERVTEPMAYCTDYQSHFNRGFAAGWLLFSALELWAAWAIYRVPAVQRVPVDRRRLQSASDEPESTVAKSVVQSDRPYIWFSVRLVIIAYCVVSGWRGFGQQAVSVPGAALAFALLWGAVGTRFWIVQAYTSVRRTEPWLRPSWFVDPFQRTQPFQFFHLAGIAFLVFGASRVLARLVSRNTVSFAEWPPEGIATAFGLGILIGIYWTIAAYRSRFVRVTSRLLG